MMRLTLVLVTAFSLWGPCGAIGQDDKTKPAFLEAKAPEIAVSTFYLATAKGDVELLKTVDREPTWAKPEVLAKLGSLVIGFRIVARAPMKKGEGVRAGDVYIRTEEFFHGFEKPGKRHFHLRKVGNGWTIINFNVDDD